MPYRPTKVLRPLVEPFARLYSVITVTIAVVVFLSILYGLHRVTLNPGIIFGVFSGVSFLWFIVSSTLGRDELERQAYMVEKSIFTISTMAVLEFFTLGLILAYFVTLLVPPASYLGNSTAPLGILPATRGNSTEWVLNLGGVSNSGVLEGGVQVPLYVIVLGAMGAFVNFLTKMPDLINVENDVDRLMKKPDNLPWEEAYVRARIGKQQDAIRLMADYFLAPLIAIGVYLLLVQSGTSSSFSIGIVALGAGLSAPSIVSRIKESVRSSTKPPASPP